MNQTDVPPADNVLMEELREEFKRAAQESLARCEEALLAFERDREKTRLIEVNRIVYSVKRAARAVELEAVGNLLHQFESRLTSFSGAFVSRETPEMSVPDFVSLALRFTQGLKGYLTPVENAEHGNLLSDLTNLLA